MCILFRIFSSLSFEAYFSHEKNLGLHFKLHENEFSYFLRIFDFIYIELLTFW